MRSIFILIIVGISFTAKGQFNQQDVNARLTVEIKKYTQMKTTGIILISAGGVLTVVGISNLSTNLFSGNPQSGALGGVFIGVVGIAILGTGIHFTSKGAKKQRELESLFSTLQYIAFLARVGSFLYILTANKFVPFGKTI